MSKFVFTGDIRNNVCYGLMYGAAKMGMHFVALGPKDLHIDDEVLHYCQEQAKLSNGKIEVLDNIEENVMLNYGCVILDVCPVKIGEHTLIGPNTHIYTACHSLVPDERISDIEFGKPVTIGKNVWIGGNCTILPGVTIGDNSVIGAGSVVTKDIPNNSIAVGNPAKVKSKNE